MLSELAKNLARLLVATSLFGMTIGSSVAQTAKDPIKPLQTPAKKLDGGASPETKKEPGEHDHNTGQREIPIDALPSLELNSDGSAKGEDTVKKENAAEKDAPPPPVLRDVSKLPEPVRRMRELILETAKKGNIEGLRNLIGLGESTTTLSIGGLEGDPIAFMKEASGDDEGYEVLAILIEVLEAGFVHVDNDTDEEVYIWPYFYSWPLEKLSAEQRVELFQILTAGDVQDSENFGSYIFYRAGIKPDGTWSFFVAGD